MRVALLTGGDDPHYAIPLAAALADHGIHVDFVGNDIMAGSPTLRHPRISYLNLRGSQNPRVHAASKAVRIARYYAKLLAFTRRAESTIFHILWLNKFEVFDRTALNIFYRLNGKKIVLTAHNVNQSKRDGADTQLNRATLRTMYALVSHIFVHTERSQHELVSDFGVPLPKISVVPYGLNTHVPDTPLTRTEARAKVGLRDDSHVLLFFGQIAPYKGLDLLVDAMTILSSLEPDLRLVVAGKVKSGAESYWEALKARLAHEPLRTRVVVNEGFIADSDVAVLFRAADALVLPYRAIYQSGPLSLAYRFGVPTIATRVGAFDQDVIENVTGLMCEPENPADLARAIARYLQSDLRLKRDQAEKRIKEIGLERYSWDAVARLTGAVYARLC